MMRASVHRLAQHEKGERLTDLVGDCFFFFCLFLLCPLFDDIGKAFPQKKTKGKWKKESQRDKNGQIEK